MIKISDKLRRSIKIYIEYLKKKLFEDRRNLSMSLNLKLSPRGELVSLISNSQEWQDIQGQKITLLLSLFLV